MPLAEVRPGMQGVGRTVFEGARVAEFGVRVLGVLDNALGPRQSLILARLVGGPLAETGVISGMSGSPVFIDGRLVGAVAYSFPFGKEPIAGITPIGEMIEATRTPAPRAASARFHAAGRLGLPAPLDRASLAATLLGTMAGIAMQRYRFRLLAILVMTPVAMPEILLGVSLLLFFIQVLNLTLGMLSIILAHITFSIGFVAVIVQAQLTRLDESLLEAARDLGASPWKTFRYITFPLILPAVVAGGLMAFTLSIDDFVVTFFTAGVGVQTLPLRIYSMIKIAVTPEVNAVSTLLMLLTLGMLALASRLAPDVLKGKA